MRTKLASSSLIIVAVLLGFTCRLALADGSTALLVKQVQSSVVRISAFDSSGKEIAQGSGFLITQEGHVITNWHVVSSAASVTVKTTSGAVFAALGLVGKDEYLDLARIAIDARNIRFPKLHLATGLPKVGERVIVLGSPFGLEATVSDGLVSGVRKTFDNRQLIQISAPISPGSSGGPVMNTRGQVVGVASFQLAKGQNLNFAVPAIYVNALRSETSVMPFAPTTSKDDDYSSRINPKVQLHENSWVKIVGYSIEKNPDASGTIGRDLFVRTQFLQYCKATKVALPNLDMNASDKELSRQFAESVMDMNLEQVIPMFRCDYRTKVFVTFYSKDNEEIGTQGTYPWAPKGQDDVSPGQNVDFFLARIPENASNLYIWVPK